MYLAFDIGNTFVKYCYFDNSGIVSTGKFLTTEKHNFSDFPLPEYAVISSVVPLKTNEISEWLESVNAKYTIIVRDDFCDLGIEYDSPGSVGIDRLCGAYGAASYYINDENDCALTIDCGTATTINYVTGKSFSGGIIIPGIITMFKSLNKGTAALPEVAPEDYVSFIGKSTKSAIASGVLNSTAALIEKAYCLLKNDSSYINVRIILTGGNSGFLSGLLDIPFISDDKLVLKGCISLFNNNLKAKLSEDLS